MSSFDIINVVGLCEGRRMEEWQQSDPKIFLCIPASVVDAATVNPKGIKTLLANWLITFFIKGNHVFSDGPRSITSNPSDCTILDDWVFDNLISVDDFLTKPYENCNNNNNN